VLRLGVGLEEGCACSGWQTKTWGPSEFTNRTVRSVKVQPLLSWGLGREVVCMQRVAAGGQGSVALCVFGESSSRVVGGKVVTTIINTIDQSSSKPQLSLSAIRCYTEHRPFGSQQEAHWAKQLLTGTQ
jgi:hypothetical protein